ncbi:Nn.00g081260.m01.CDS01 [Neocucurbitaria sp. VM-36]
MASLNPLNVYSGPNAVRKYFDPDFHPPLPLVEIPKDLNPFYEDGVRIYAKMMSMHPANNVKIIPAMNMLAREVLPGRTKTIIEYSSGSTVISLALASRIYHGLEDVRAFLSNKTTLSKLRLMQFFGLDITLFGGPSQPNPLDGRGGIQRAKTMAEHDETVLNANQYENDANWQAHVKWTGPQIHAQLPNINRSLSLLSPVDFPWRDPVDGMEEVGSKEAFGLSLHLSREGLICGPSSGFNLKGLLNYLHKQKIAGTISDLVGPDGLINCVFICCDLPYQYIDEYVAKLSTHDFHPIRNHNLAEVDSYRYDEAWALQPGEALSHFADDTTLKPDPVLIDLRAPSNFIASQISGAYNLPLQNLKISTPSPFSDATVLESQWRDLEAMLTSDRINAHDLSGKNVCLICYNGDTARIATSILRSKSIIAISIKGGYGALKRVFSDLQTSKQNSGLIQPSSKIPTALVRELRADCLSSQARGRTGVQVEAL